uniref:Uncharacterized protein n=1 Tax=Caenorhabditis japonica TaxID=281687 RepID=A0A8R1DVC9_CAEJA
MTKITGKLKKCRKIAKDKHLKASKIMFFNREIQDKLNEHLEEKKVQAEKTISEKSAELESITSEMERIKKVLYSKFGDQINLDAEE